MSTQLARLIATNPLFEHLPPDRQAQVMPLVHARDHDTGITLDAPSVGRDRMFVLAAGVARVVRRDAAGRTVAVGLLDPGDVFGTVLGVTPRPGERVEALEPATVLSLRAADLPSLFAIDPSIAALVIEHLARRVADGGDRLESLALRTVPARLAVALLDLAERRGRVTPNGVRIGVRITHGGLAELVGTTRETLTKVAGWLRDEGIATHGRRQILIHDAARLDDVASGVLVMPGRSGGSRSVRLGPAPSRARAS